MNDFPFPPSDAPASARAWMSELKDALEERFKTGEGSPEGVVTANPGCIYQRTDGGASTTLYVKTSGVGTSTGWTAK